MWNKIERFFLSYDKIFLVMGILPAYPYGFKDFREVRSDGISTSYDNT